MSSDPRYDQLHHRLNEVRARGLWRELEPLLDASGQPRFFISLCSNDYLGLSQHPEVVAAAQEAARCYGAGSTSARLVAGELRIHRELEDALASFLQVEAALLFPTGFQTNLGLLGVLPGPGGVIFSDALNHASIIDGCRLSRARSEIFPHNGLETLRQKLEGCAEPARLIVTESIFSMDGDAAPVGALQALAREHNALLAVDEAHALGVVGPGGRGVAALSGGCDIVVGALGKAFGAAGGFVAGRQVVREALINLARSFIFTTGPAPAAVGAALASLRLFSRDDGLRESLAENVRFLRAGLRQLGFEVGPGEGHIIPVLLGEPETAVALARSVQAGGVFVRAIRPPTVPAGTSRLRITPSARHSREELERALEVFEQAARALPQAVRPVP